MVGNLRIVVSRYFVFAFLSGACLLTAGRVALAQSPAAADPAAATPAAEKSAEEQPAEVKKPAESGGQIRSKIEYAEPVLTKEDEQNIRRTLLLRVQRALKSIAPTNAERKDLEDWARFSVDRMTMPEYRSELPRLVIDPARRSAEGQLTAAAPKSILLKAMNDRCIELLAKKPSHHPDVQLGLAILMTTMNAATPSNKTPVPYTAGYKTIVSLVENTAVPLQCRIIAAGGLLRIARDSVVGTTDGDLTTVQRNEISVALANVLVSTDAAGNDEGKIWFRTIVADALGDCGLAFDLNGRSTPIDSLMTIATNPKEMLRVRATAMKAATQTAWNAQTNVKLILHETMKLVVEVAKANNAAVAANPATKTLPADLSHANLEVYFCFQAKTSAQVTLKQGLLNQVTRPGLTANGQLVTAAYDIAMPVINHVLSKAKSPVVVPNATLAAVDTWLKENAPTDRKVTPVSPAPLP